MIEFGEASLIKDAIKDRPLSTLAPQKSTSRHAITSRININGNNLEILHTNQVPQLKLPDDKIWKLNRNSQGLWELNPSTPDSPLSPQSPEGKLTFVIRHNDPENIFCFEHSAIAENEALRNRTAGPVNFGHSSLANKYNNILEAFRDRNNLKNKDELLDTAHPVLLAGHLYFGFNEEGSSINGAGRLIKWTRESGHYLPSKEHAIHNRIGKAIDILPMDLFTDVAFKETN